MEKIHGCLPRGPSPIADETPRAGLPQCVPRSLFMRSETERKRSPGEKTCIAITLNTSEGKFSPELAEKKVIQMEDNPGGWKQGEEGVQN